MLRRVDTARIAYRPGRISGKGYITLVIGRRSTAIAGGRKIKRVVFEQAKVQQRAFPVFLCEMEGRHYWQFQDRVFSDNDRLTAEQVHALLTTRLLREQQKVERAVAMVKRGVMESASARGTIPDDVKQFIWQRDSGRCRRCESVHELQFDHIIPVAMGGSSEPENLQLLCGPCNRLKGASLTARG